jgi:hypothetical protein
MALFPLPSLLPFFSHFTHETYIQTVLNCSTRYSYYARAHFGAVESQEDYFNGLSFAIIGSVESCFTNDHTVVTKPAVREPRELQDIIEYAMYTRHGTEGTVVPGEARFGLWVGTRQNSPRRAGPDHALDLRVWSHITYLHMWSRPDLDHAWSFLS